MFSSEALSVNSYSASFTLPSGVIRFSGTLRNVSSSNAANFSFKLNLCTIFSNVAGSSFFNVAMSCFFCVSHSSFVVSGKH